MSVKSFFYGIIAAFGVPWLVIIVIPFAKMRDSQPIEFVESEDGQTGIYQPKRNGLVGQGAAVYSQENCGSCHTQLVRPTYAGNDIFRPGWGERETTRFDFDAEKAALVKMAPIGQRRLGPDLANYGVRVEQEALGINSEPVDKVNNEKLEVAKKAIAEFNAKVLEKAKAAGKSEEDEDVQKQLKPEPTIATLDGAMKVSDLTAEQRVTAEQLIYLHLFNPRKDVPASEGQKDWSTCQANPSMFKKVPVAGPRAINGALPLETKAGKQIVPSARAKALASYLLSLKRNDKVPYSVDYDRNKKKASEK